MTSIGMIVGNKHQKKLQRLENLNILYQTLRAAKIGRGNISPTTLILPTLAEKSKLKVGKKIDNQTILDEMINQFKAEEQRDPTEEELKEIKKFVENR